MKRTIEPYASSAVSMFAALKGFADRGVHTGINIDPVIPGLTDDREQIDRLIAVAAENGAEFASGAVLRLRADIWKRLRELLIVRGDSRAIERIRKQYFLSPRIASGYFLATQ